MAFEHVHSILLADIGSVHTRLALIDVVEGQYRFVAGGRARTTAEAPMGNVSFGLDRAAQQITDATGRRLIAPDSESLFIMPETNGHGIDQFLATASAGRPMRVLLVGVTPEMSLASAQHVLAGTTVTVVETLSPYDRRTPDERVSAILSAHPDLILIVGGTDDGADAILLQLVMSVRDALTSLRSQTPGVLFAGNRDLRQSIKRLLSSRTTVFYARNVRPDMREEQVFPAQIELALAYDDFRSRQQGGFIEVARRSPIGVVPTIQGTISAVRYLADQPQSSLGPLVVDVGSANSLMVAGVNGEARFSVRTDLGIGHNLAGALDALKPDTLRKWLPPDVTDDELWDYAYNKELRPATVPASPRDLMIEQAAAREIVRLMLREARDEWGVGRGDLLPEFGPVIAAGAVLTEAQHPGVSAMLLLDALQPVGVTDLRLDPYNMLSGLGVAAYLNPLITVQMLDGGALPSLATAFSPMGSARSGQNAMNVQIRTASGRTIKHAVRGGEIWMAPVSPGMSCEVMVKLRRGLSINGKQRLKLNVMAGSAGIIFDARGRPLVMPRPKDRMARFERWLAAMMGADSAPDEDSAREDDVIAQEDAAHAVLS
ncbi:MAG TPA: glutamate mutase L [Aggregatilinea sp.]|uniref:glutamate mutase L n=1 Tax=Aggregatilinea sp. TaxID=2806333 RepID=UPI002BE88D64|nr:glutamate mutase L [Aggregatilinea sp.]HML22036.1 glutamate mutase L [Aggregatilinea sp.]